MTAYFITSTGTGVGKTFFTAAMMHRYTWGGYPACALKPVISGYVDNDPTTDTAVLLRASNLALTQKNISAMSPWRFTLPASPHFAARAENRIIEASAVIDWCVKSIMPTGITLLEGAGGIMAPLNETHTMRDLMLALPVREIVLVVGSYLGSISHTLTALHLLPAERLHAVVITQSAEQCAGLEETREAILQFAPYALTVYTIPRVYAETDAWKHALLPDDLCQTLV